MKRWACIGLALGALGLGQAAFAAQGSDAGKVAVPDELKQWKGWVEQSKSDRMCAGGICKWHGPMLAEKAGAGMKFSWTVSNMGQAPALARLPGDESRWPSKVLADGKPAPVIRAEGMPYVEIAGGAQAKVEAWLDSVAGGALPADPGLAAAKFGNRIVFQGNEGFLFEAQESASAMPGASGAAEIALSLQRRLDDGTHPSLTTRIVVENPGQKRQISIWGLLPEGGEPVAFVGNSGRWEGGTLSFVVPQGESVAVLEARIPEDLAALKMQPAVAKGAVLKEGQTWSIASDPALRNIAASGQAIDPAAAKLDPAWRGLPAFMVSNGSAPAIAVKPKEDGKAPLSLRSSELTYVFGLGSPSYILRQRMQLSAKTQAALAFKKGDPDLTHATGPGGAALPIFDAGDYKTIPMAVGDSEVVSYLKGSEMPYGLEIDLRRGLPEGMDTMEADSRVYLRVPGGWKVVWSENIMSKIGPFAAFTMWDWFILAISVWGAFKIAGARCAAALGFGLVFGRLYAGSAFGIYLPVMLFAAMGGRFGQMGWNSARKASFAAAGVFGALCALILANFTIERFLSLIHPTMDVLQQPNGQALGGGGLRRIASGLSSQFESAAWLLSAACYVGGIVLIVGALWRLIKYKKGETSIAKQMGFVVVGFFVMSLPSWLQAGRDTVFGDSADNYGPAGESGLHFGASVSVGEGGGGLPPGVMASGLDFGKPVPAAAPAAPEAAMKQEARGNLEMRKSAALPGISADKEKRSLSGAEASVAGYGYPTWSWNEFSFEADRGVDKVKVYMMPPWASRILGLLLAASYWFSLALIWRSATGPSSAGGVMEQIKDLAQKAKGEGK